MKSYTITSHVADQVAALDVGARRRRVLLRPFAQALLVAIGGGVAFFALRGQTVTALIIGGAGGIVLLLLGVLAVAGPNERDVAIKRAGAAGEAVLPQVLRSLPDTFTLLNGVPVPGSRADIDHVLVGPNGIWAIEAKHHVGMVQCVGDAWGYARLRRGGVPQPGHIGNPSQQAQRAANALERYLQRRGVDQLVQPLVVFTHPQVELTIEQPTVPIVRAGEAQQFISRSRRQIAATEVDRIVTVLRKLRQLP
jgi:hypothetical protein